MKLVSFLFRSAIIAAGAFASTLVNGTPSIALFSAATVAFVVLIAGHDYSSRRRIRLSIDETGLAHSNARQLTLRLAA